MNESSGNLKNKASYKLTKTALLEELMNLSRYQLRFQRFSSFLRGGAQSEDTLSDVNANTKGGF